MDSNTRLRIATRIHFALLRHLGDSVEVQEILHRPKQTREVLWVCEASGDDELIALATQFRQASRPGATAATTAPPLAPMTVTATTSTPASRSDRSAAPADTSWGRDTSGFGVSHPPELRPGSTDGVSAARKRAPRQERDWLKPSTWLRTR